MKIQEIPLIKETLIRIKTSEIKIKDRTKTLAEAREEAEAIVNNKLNNQ